MSQTKILSNEAKCGVCGEVITSTHRHDFVTCTCGNLSVDGGLDYLKRCGNLDDYVELSTFAEEEDGPST